MSQHTIADLRRRLFESIDGVKNGTLDIDRAKIVSDLSQVIVNTAKVEVEYLRATGGGESDFIEAADAADAAETPPAKLPNGITGIVQHRLKG